MPVKRKEAVERDELEEREQIHLWLRRKDALLLRRIAQVRGQTLSGAVSYLLRRMSSVADRTAE